MRGDAFERLWESHAKQLLGFLIYRTGDPALSEDLVADTFERVLRSRQRFDPRKSSEKTWIYTIALNRLRDHQRRRDAEGRALQQVHVPDDPDASVASGIEARDAVSRALEVLSEKEHEAISLRYGGDLTLPEIARLQGEKLSTIQGRVYGALRKLREEMDQA